jgi:hypothetical protein
MGLSRAWRSGWPRAAVGVGLVVLLVQCGARQTQAQAPRKGAENAATTGACRDVRSRYFLLHTDLSEREAHDLVERLEVMLREISTYWGRPMQGTIECYVVRDFNNFPLAAMHPWGVCGIRTAGGMTLMRTATAGNSYLAKSMVYANARPEVVRHEAVHAYCHQTFGRIGPVWYSEGMAEMGHYWKEGDPSVRVEQREIHFLSANPPKSLADTLSRSQVTGDSWQNYASRWALCHFLVHDPNYAPQFLSMGRGILTGKDISFDQTYGATARELWFEYRFFLQHIGRGYRVDLCSWDWNKKFAGLRPGHTLTATIKAGRGWQPTGLTVAPGMRYEYSATGNCRIASRYKAVDANGDDHGRGRLVGVLMNDYRLSAEFDLGGQGSLQLPAAGDLYLRCRNAWNELTDDSGGVAISLQRPGGAVALRKAAQPVVAAAATKTVTAAGRVELPRIGSMNAAAAAAPVNAGQ